MTDVLINIEAQSQSATRQIDFLRQSLGQVSNTLDTVERDTRQTTAATVAYTAATNQNTVAQTRNNTTQRTGRQLLGNTAASVNNLAFQVQDFAVQVAGGTSALRAFAQQAPQAASALGSVFASTSRFIPIAGTIAGIGAALAPVIIQLAFGADKAEDFSEALEELTERASNAARALRGITLGIDRDELEFLETRERLTAAIAAQEDKVAAAKEKSGRSARAAFLNEQRVLASLQEQLEAAQADEDARKASVEEAKRLKEEVDKTTEAERLLGQQLTDAANEAARLRGEMVLTAIKAREAAQEFVKLQEFRSRFAGEELLFNQPVVVPGRGEPPPELDEPDDDDGRGRGAARISEEDRVLREIIELRRQAQEDTRQIVLDGVTQEAAIRKRAEDDIAEVRRLAREARISDEEEVANAIAAINKRAAAELDSLRLDSIRKVSDAIENQLGSAFFDLGQQIGETGKVGDDFALKLVADLAKVAGQQLINIALQQLFNSLLSGGGGGFFGGIGSLVGGLFSASASPSASPVSVGAVGANTNSSPGSSGAPVGVESFNQAPSAYSTTTVGSVSAGQRGQSNGGVSVVVNNNAPNTVVESRLDDSDVIQIAVNQAINESELRFSQSLRSGYGTYANALGQFTGAKKLVG